MAVHRHSLRLLAFSSLEWDLWHIPPTKSASAWDQRTRLACWGSQLWKKGPGTPADHLDGRAACKEQDRQVVFLGGGFAPLWG